MGRFYEPLLIIPSPISAFPLLGGGRSNQEAAVVEVEGQQTVVVVGGNVMTKPFHPKWVLMFQLQCA